MWKFHFLCSFIIIFFIILQLLGLFSALTANGISPETYFYVDPNYFEPNLNDFLPLLVFLCWAVMTWWSWIPLQRQDDNGEKSAASKERTELVQLDQSERSKQQQDT